MQVKVKGILSYPHLFTPRAVTQGDDPKYSANVLLHESDPQIQSVRQAIETEKANGWPNGFPHNGRECLTPSQQYPGYYEIRANAKADSKPAVVDGSLQPVLDPALVVPGEIVWMAFNTFPYNLTTSKGVGAGLNAVMITGELGSLGRLDSRPTIEETFGDVASGAPAHQQPRAPDFSQPPPAPPAAAAPPPPPPPAAAAPPPPPPPPPAAPQFIMTAAAGGMTREAYLAAGWTDEQLISGGLMTKS